MPEGELSFDDLFLFIQKSEKDLHAFAEPLSSQDVGNKLQKLKTAVDNIGAKTVTRPPPIDLYMQQWEQFVVKRRKDLDRGAVRYLCWEPGIAVGQPFLDYIDRSETELNPRALQGLVYSCHALWTDSTERKKAFARVMQLVLAYQGSNRVVGKWQSNINAILGSSGPEILAGKFIDAQTSLKNWFEAWYLDPQLAFARHLVLSGTERCRTRMGTTLGVTEPLFTELLPWPGWDPKEFKAQVAELILDGDFHKIQDIMQPFVLRHKSLGDPRIPRNRQNWLGIPQAAIDRFCEILCKEDIAFFFDHVLPEAVDRQNRKQFWLQYVSRCKASRPLLGYNDRVRLKPFFQQYKGGIEHFGELKSNYNSAFLLDFGNIIVVDFSKMGACFIYDVRDFNRIVPDFWSRSGFTEYGLKDSGNIERIIHRHTTNIDWRNQARQVLAAQGIRPGSTS